MVLFDIDYDYIPNKTYTTIKDIGPNSAKTCEEIIRRNNDGCEIIDINYNKQIKELTIISDNELNTNCWYNRKSSDADLMKNYSFESYLTKIIERGKEDFTDCISLKDLFNLWNKEICIAENKLKEQIRNLLEFETKKYYSPIDFKYFSKGSKSMTINFSDMYLTVIKDSNDDLKIINISDSFKKVIPEITYEIKKLYDIEKTIDDADYYTFDSANSSINLKIEKNGIKVIFPSTKKYEYFQKFFDDKSKEYGLDSLNAINFLNENEGEILNNILFKVDDLPEIIRTKAEKYKPKTNKSKSKILSIFKRKKAN